ncbi:MAG: hypothetical protein ABEJ67_05080 [Halanaeroarchaeum sp.]
MHRRSLLAGAAGLGASALAGCFGRSADRFHLQVVNTDFGESEDGYLQVTVSVSNVGNEREAGTLYVSSQLNDESIVRVRDVSLAAHATREYTIEYDVKMADVRSFSPSASIEPKTE